jgi:hypothetical protein
VVIDDDQQSSENYYNILGSVRKQFPKEVNDRIAELGFGNDVAYPGLQAADMIAYRIEATDGRTQERPQRAAIPVIWGTD